MQRDVDHMRVRGEGASEPLITNEEDIHVASRALKAMAHPLRLKILCIVGGRTEICVQEIVEQAGTSQSNISQHLSIMREKGILAFRKDANKVYYRLGDARVVKLIDSLLDTFCRSRV
jgi:ArsR family transcriptional regulator